MGIIRRRGLRTAGTEAIRAFLLKPWRSDLLNRLPILGAEQVRAYWFAHRAELLAEFAERYWPGAKPLGFCLFEGSRRDGVGPKRHGWRKGDPPPVDPEDADEEDVAPWSDDA